VDGNRMFQEKWTDDYFLLKLWKIKHYVRLHYVEK